MWAVLLGLALVLVAATSAHAATSLGDRTLHVPMKGHDVRTLQQELGERRPAVGCADRLLRPR